MKINEKVIWFGLGMILPIVIGGLYLLKQQNDSDSEPGENYSMVPDIEVEPPETEAPVSSVPEQTPPPVVDQLPKAVTTTVAETESPANEGPEDPPDEDPPRVPEKTADSPASETGGKPVVESAAPAAAEVKPKPEPVKPEPKPVEKPPPPPTEYILKSGDNPWLIAQKFGISTEELLEENKDLNPKKLQIGQVLKLPKTARIVSPEEKIKKVAVAEKPVEEEPSNGEFEWYTIKSGENPWTISRKLKVDHQQVMELNKDLNFRDLKIGQKIKVPKKK